MSVALILLVVFIVLLLLDVPIAHCMLFSSLIALISMGVDPIMVGLETSRSLTSFYSFLAVPFFILAGELMNSGGLSNRLVNMVRSVIGHHKVGMPGVTVISSQLFGSVSGASAATCAAIGSVMIPAMEKKGFSRSFSTALTACAGTTGALIPPSIVLLIYGTVANVSIEKLFIGGIVPGILVGTGLFIVCWRMVRKWEIIQDPRSGFREVVLSFKNAFFAIFLAVMIFAGIMGGVFTATEASAVAVVYAASVGFFIYRELKLKDLPGILVSSAKTTASLSFLIACASLFSWTLSIGKVPELLTSGLMETSDSIVSMFGNSLEPALADILRKVVILLILNFSLLLVGMFIDAGPGLLIVVPVVLPISAAIGMETGLSAIHFGVMVVSNLIIGLVTPPVGSTLFIAAAVGKVSVSSLVPHVLKFLLVMIAVQLLIVFIPAITTLLPSFMD